MKVFTRIITKLLILLVVIAAAVCAAVGWRTYQRSKPDYIMNQYLTCLLDNDYEKAFELLDQSEETEMTLEEYAEALRGKRYSLSSAFSASELQKRGDSNGNEYTDFHAEFKDAADELQFEDDFILKKQASPAFGIFDRWKVLSGHCMVKNLRITVPTGSQVYLDNNLLDPLWIVRDDIPWSRDCYSIPGLIPGKKDLVIRHTELETVNTMLDTNDGDQDYSAQMTLKKAARDECMSLGISALKQFYVAAVKEKSEEFSTIFAACADETEQTAMTQKAVFREENHAFRSVGVSDFVPQYGPLVLAEGEDSAFTTEVTLGYHYILREDVTEDTGEVYDDGTPIEQTEQVTRSGDLTAKFVMTYRDGAWSILHAEIPVIPADDAENDTPQGDTDSDTAQNDGENGTV